jgi:hypothetical protein
MAFASTMILRRSISRFGKETVRVQTTAPASLLWCPKTACPKTSVCGQGKLHYPDHAVSTVCDRKRCGVFGQHKRRRTHDRINEYDDDFVPTVLLGAFPSISLQSPNKTLRTFWARVPASAARNLDSIPAFCSKLSAYSGSKVLFPERDASMKLCTGRIRQVRVVTLSALIGGRQLEHHSTPSPLVAAR